MEKRHEVIKLDWIAYNADFIKNHVCNQYFQAHITKYEWTTKACWDSDKAPTGWKSFSTLPIFTKREINFHVSKCCKLKRKSILKTPVRLNLLKDERFLSSNSEYTACNQLYLYVKARRKRSTTKELRNVRI